VTAFRVHHVNLRPWWRKKDAAMISMFLSKLQSYPIAGCLFETYHSIDQASVEEDPPAKSFGGFQIGQGYIDCAMRKGSHIKPR